MRLLKIGLLVGLIVLSAGIAFYLFCFSPKQPEQFQPIPPPIAEKTPAANPVSDHLERDEKLQNETNALLPLFDKMPTVPIFLTDEAITKSGGSTEKGVAFTDCDHNDQPSIFIKQTFYRKANQKQIVNILKHELTHAWLCRQHQMSVGHGPAFRQKFKQVGGFGN